VLKGDGVKGLSYRLGLRIFNLGVKLRAVWIMAIGDRIKRRAMGEYI